jgi:hypothetical protein
MIKVLGLISAVISGICLAIIGLRKKLPLFGGIFSPKLNEDIDSTDKYLALAGLLFFLIAMLCLVMLQE